MAKVLNPLFSLSASGRFGNIVYESGRYGPYVKVHVPQRKKPTERQLEQNFRFGMAADAWRLLTDSEKDEYRKKSSHLQMTGFNLFIREYFERFYP